MLVKKIAFGDEREAFIEDRLIDGVNIIFSDDNNRGKTLVMQGLMYSIGYDSIFPSSFNYKEKYFYSCLYVNEEIYEFIRKKNSIVAKTEGSIQVFNSVGEFRYYFDQFVHPVPKILKDERLTTVNLSLLYEIFFVGQDGRNPSGLISKGQFNKADFKSMVYEIANLSGDQLNDVDIKETKEQIKNLKLKLKETKKKISLIKSNPDIAELVSKSYDSERVQKKIKNISSINENISKLRRSRQREINRKLKLERLVSELNSLNRDLNEGNIKCGDCGSERIVYSNNDMTFEISNVDVRNGILKSIEANINQKTDIIWDYSNDINRLQNTLDQELQETPPSFQEIVLYQKQVVSDQSYDDEAFLIKNQIDSLNEKFVTSKNINESLKSDRKSLDKSIIDEMADLCRKIDPNGNLEFEDIFTKRDSTFSGSEEQEFYFCKVIALNNVLKHVFPIIVDSFRDGEISTLKEQKMLDVYTQLNKQVILTSTLKMEEYSSDKYSSDKLINAIDYSQHEDCKILSEAMSEEFTDLVLSFNGLIL